MASSELTNSWSEIKKWLVQNAPGVYESLLPAASVQDLQRIEKQYNMSVPSDLSELLMLHNGQEMSGSKRGNFMFGFEFLSISSSLSMHNGAVVDYIDDIDFSNFEYIHESIVPENNTPLHFYRLLESQTMSSLCLDFKPSPKGAVGQVVLFDTEVNSAFKISNSLIDLLKLFSSDLKAGLYTVSDNKNEIWGASKEVDLANWGYNKMYKQYPDGRST